jgi:uncharacterized protein (TIGR03066 family)
MPLVCLVNSQEQAHRNVKHLYEKWITGEVSIRGSRMRKVTVVAFAVLLAACLLFAGCGGKTGAINVAGRTYLNSQEQADSRTLQFNQDGTFVYSIVTTEKSLKGQGTYEVAAGKVTLTFYPQGEMSEFAGKTLELKTENQILVDPDGSRWLVM